MDVLFVAEDELGVGAGEGAGGVDAVAGLVFGDAVADGFDRLRGQGLAQRLMVKISYAWEAF